MATETISTLKAKRTILKGQLTRYKNNFNSIDKNKATNAIVSQCNARLEKIIPLLDEFNEVQTKIELLDATDIENNENERESFENSYFALVGDMQAFINDFSGSVANIQLETDNNSETGSRASSVSSSSRNDIQSIIKLPPIKLPTFDGKYEHWLEFKDAFSALVDLNESLNDIQKFYYLRSSLEKEASHIIKSIEISAANYKSTWDLIVDRYENKKLIVHNHIKAIFDHPNVNKESHVELRNLYDNVSKHLRSLKTLGEKTDEWDRLIIYIISNKFDSVTKRDWESHKYEGELPSMLDLNQFLKSKCEMLEKLEITRNEKHRPQSFHTNYKKHNSNSFASTDFKKSQCPYCKQSHYIYSCASFLELNIPERINAAKNMHLCLNCLRDRHCSWNCKAKTCKKCHKAHNSLLHLELNNTGVPYSHVNNTNSTLPSNSREIVATVDDRSDDQVTLNNHTVTGAVATLSNTSQVLLSTAQVQIKVNNHLVIARALLDSGSQSHFITENFCKKLNLKTNKITHTVKGVGEALANISKQVNISLKSCYNNFNMNISCLVIPKITDKLPIISFNKNMLKIPDKINLADPNFNSSNDIDILLGSGVFWSILVHGQQRLGYNMPLLQNTKLGWVVAGNLFYDPTKYKTQSLNCLSINSESSLDDKITKFWELEEVNNKTSILSESEKYCEEHFKKNTKRDDSGRFIVSIPFKKSITDLGNSRESALKRFYSLEKKLIKNPELKVLYDDFMKEYIELNHMSEIEENKYIITEGYYLPHHAVLKDSSLTTKCRVVFDASAKTDTGLSLNDMQFCGPTLQSSIFSILLRFRKFNYVMTADISKMYRQILISEDQRKYQKIFWRFSPNDDLKCYQLNTVTYGTVSAPYLAVRCLVELGRANEINFPSASETIKHSFYMDDLLTGADTVVELLQLQKEVSEILSSAGFELRKWLCNDSCILNKFHTNDRLENNILQIGEHEQNKTLGIFWNASRDTIQYSLNNFKMTDICTKRSILSMTCQIFDPLGLLGPIIIIAKLIIQEMWKLKLSWDETVPSNIQIKWLQIKNELPNINNYNIHRQILFSTFITLELHGFCDSSERAYGACLYIRCISSSGEIISNLLCAKSRVAPLKQISLPRLELCGAALLAKLKKNAVEALEVNFHKIFYWSDSTIVLAWIKGPCSKWKTFVANRVSEIQSTTNVNNWYHVNSAENPADLLSRGATPDSLYHNRLWWHGPSWFAEDCSSWNLEYSDINSDIPEQKTICHVVMVKNNNLLSNLLTKFSSLMRIQRIVAYVLRFISNTKLNKNIRQYGSLTPNELENALNTLIIFTQRECFSVEYELLMNNKTLPNKSKILSLNPFMQNQLIRVGGRIKNAKLPYEKRHPIILPRSHVLTKLIIRHEHERLLHCGTQTLLCSIRDKYWPIAARNTCKYIVNSCVICFKAKPVTSDYLMGDLPESRVNNYSPFYNVGVDYGGPFYLKTSKTKNSKLTKAYICLFVCMCTKAVHLELVSELTTEAFLATLIRFVNRRGKPANIFSDNALNFVGAKNELYNLYKFLELESESIADQLAKDRIKWNFIPARTPNHGGLWEANIKRVKFHIKRVIGQTSLTFEGFSTVLAQIEGILNSRPLCPLTCDPDDLSALTPAHFLIGKQLTALPELNLMDVPENRLNKFQKLQAISQHYWSRWQKEYLSELQIRNKWKQRSQQLLKVGALVLVKKDTSHTLEWQLGRILALHPGSDGVIRVVDIKTRAGEIRRSVRNICVLPVE